MIKNKNLLIHVCCAPCAISYLEKYKDNQISLFFYNPNIMPKEEYQKRLTEIKKLADIYQVKLIEGKYDQQKFVKLTAGLEKEEEGGKRCLLCFRLRLAETFKMSNDYHFFMTTLIISSHKDSDVINKIGQEISGKYLETSFSQEEYLSGLEAVKKHQFYRQKYCGCQFF